MKLYLKEKVYDGSIELTFMDKDNNPRQIFMSIQKLHDAVFEYADKNTPSDAVSYSLISNK